MPEFEIIRIEAISLEEFHPLLADSREGGYEFLDRLLREYLDGSNRFTAPGEALFGAFSGQRMIAIGGLNRDPYLKEESAGRVRHLYVLASWRGQGVGGQLMNCIVAAARLHFGLLTLRTFSERAGKFYCGLGFQTHPEIPGATHHLVLQD